MIKERLTTSSAQTKNLASELAKTLKPPCVLAFYGNLGAGKTTFIQGLADGLGIKQRILSPTFVFIRSYNLPTGGKFHHVDLYRIEQGANLEVLGLKEILADKDSIIAIEWPEKAEHFLPKNTVKIKLESVGENERKISL